MRGLLIATLRMKMTALRRSVLERLIVDDGTVFDGLKKVFDDEGIKASLKTDIDVLTNLVSKFSYDFEEHEIPALENWFVKASQPDGDLETAVRIVIDRCFKEWKFASAASRICASYNSSRGDDKVRNILLKELQNHYINKEQYRAESTTTKWLGFVSLLTNCTREFVSPNGKPIGILVKFSTECLQACLQPDACEEEMACAAELLLTHRKMLVGDPENEERAQALRDSATTIIIDGRGSKKLRLDLVDIRSQWHLN